MTCSAVGGDGARPRSVVQQANSTPRGGRSKPRRFDRMEEHSAGCTTGGPRREAVAGWADCRCAEHRYATRRRSAVTLGARVVAPGGRCAPRSVAQDERRLVDGLEGLVQRADQRTLRVAAVPVAHQRLDLAALMQHVAADEQAGEELEAAAIMSVVLQATTLPSSATSSTTPTRLYIA